MALQPSLSFQRLVGEKGADVHTLEIFVDFVCPFSGKIAKSIENNLKPLISQGGKYVGKVQLIVRLHPQPWHASSTFTHEAALAVGRVDPAAFWPFSLALFEKQGDYYDGPTSTLTPLQIRASLIALASQFLSGHKMKELEELLTIKGTPNGGISVTDDLKYNVKYSRANSIHVSPTALWDGLVANEVSSSFGKAEWESFLEKKVA